MTGHDPHPAAIDATLARDAPLIRVTCGHSWTPAAPRERIGPWLALYVAAMLTFVMLVAGTQTLIVLMSWSFVLTVIPWGMAGWFALVTRLAWREIFVPVRCPRCGACDRLPLASEEGLARAGRGLRPRWHLPPRGMRLITGMLVLGLLVPVLTLACIWNVGDVRRW